MCEQCLAKTKMLVEDIVPGFFLVQAEQDGSVMKNGQYGLVRINDPDCYFDKIVADPFRGLTDDQIDALPKEDFAKQKPFSDAVAELEESMTSDDIMAHWQLVDACKKAGYNPEVDGYRICAWLMDHMAKSLEGLKNG